MTKPAETPEHVAARVAMNREFIDKLQADLAQNPSLDLDFTISSLLIEGKMKYFPHPVAKLLQERRNPPPPKRQRQDFVDTCLRSKAKPVVLSPLSDAAKMLIFSASPEDGGPKRKCSLQEGVRRMIKGGEVIADLRNRGGILRCGAGSGPDIAVKIVEPGMEADTEYSALQYLAEHSPGFPAPKPHGVVRLGNSRLILMSYIPSETLKSVWPALSHENKLSIQKELNTLFTKLRELKQKQGGRLGGVGGEGVADFHAWVEHTDTKTVMTTAAEFRDFQFSIRAPRGPEYAEFLKSLLPHPNANEPAVFTHGDLFCGNIMVDLDPGTPGEYVVTGIIDWETSGFYPPWFEASKLLYTFTDSGVDIQDWWRYVPGCIAPASRPAEWAVGRLWDKANGINV